MRERLDRGFTLIELLISIVLGGVIAGVTVAALFTTMNLAASTTDEVNDSTDAGLIAAFLYRDTQSAGAVDQTTGQLAADVGISTSTTSTEWSRCEQTGADMVVGFSWIDHMSTTAQSRVYVTYALDSSQQLIRRSCTYGASGPPVVSEAVLGRHVGTASATCKPTSNCTTRSTSVTLEVKGAGVRAPVLFTMTGSLRGTLEGQGPLTHDNSSFVALVALGDPAAAAPCPNLTLSGTGDVTVRGDALVDATCTALSDTPPIAGNVTTLQPTGTSSSFVGVRDPLSAHVAPSNSCAAGGSNPAHVGQSAGPDALNVYPQAVSLTTSTDFMPGRYVFCAGLEIKDGVTTSKRGEVFFYVAGGTFTVDAAATVDLTAPTSGVNTNLLLWVVTPQTVAVNGGTHASSLRGLVYAPQSTVQVTGPLAVNIGGLVVARATISGSGGVRVGPVPVQIITPSTLAAGEVGVSYGAALEATGGTAPATWIASGLPPGLTIDAATGTMSGTPTTAGSFAVVVTTLDATKAAASLDYIITIADRLAVSGAQTVSGQVGVDIAPLTPIVSGGTPPYSWSATGLPAGLTIDAAGVVSGRPTEAGTFSATLIATDALGGVASLDVVATIAPAAPTLSVSGPATLPAGKVGSAYPATTVSASGGTPPFAWSATDLPTGLSINASTGTISGTPTVASTFSVVVTVTDAASQQAQAAYSVTVVPADVVPPGCPSAPAGWRGEYYSNRTLTGNPVLCRDDANINFNWSGSPGSPVPPNNFSVRWVRTQAFVGGTYTFAMGSDAGSRLYLDGVLVLDRWVDQKYPSPIPNVGVQLTDGNHTIVMEYYEKSGTARATLTWSPGPPSCLLTGNGWLGAYFNNVDLSGTPTMCRWDAAVNFDWANGAPAAGLPSDNFSVRWTRTQWFSDHNYTFKLGTDDGGRLYIDGVLVIDRWVDQAYPTPQPQFVKKMSEGYHTIVIEYYERGGAAKATVTIT